MSNDKNARTLEGLAADQLISRINTVADRLRSLSDTVRQQQRAPMRAYADLAAAVQHEVLWGLANLNLDGLTNAAAEADAARLAEEG